ncbi:putative short transient receptor potential channel 2-like protein [Nephila pilipes]|uniref:Putative short transient receptor potential channel 2-like protein n=1 Tax=Nephila pilipes TaxID=299642 RepID=A0A8X6NTX5_NEPPI|nr:putative short transient receptor potential channel 2-like protein [Nephila pilipes]
MGVISLDYVISYSSQDDVYKVDNLLHNPGASKPWLCAPHDKTGRLEAEFQFDKASFIDFIDIGNHGSCMVEIQVGRSSFQNRTSYVSFLPAVTMLSLADLKEGVDYDAVYMFNRSNFNEAVAVEKWDRIKVICCQPYKKGSRFGLSFLSLRSKEPRSQLSINNQHVFNERTEKSFTQRFKKRESRLSTPDISISRGKQLLKASKSKISNGMPTSKPSSDRLEDITIFLIACMGDDVENKSLEEYLKEFEEQRQLKLSPSEKHVFRNKYLDLFHGNVITSEFNSESNFMSLSPSYSPNSISECNSPRSTKVVSSSPDIVELDFEDKSAEVPTFDLILSTPVKRKSSTVSGERKAKSSRKSLIPKRHSSPTELLRTRPEDFIQFDGVQPSTSSGITYVDCPICRESFPSSEIEKHAATCGDLLASSSKYQEEDVFVSCPICNEFYLEKDMSAHIDKCSI